MVGADMSKTFSLNFNVGLNLDSRSRHESHFGKSIDISPYFGLDVDLGFSH